MKKTLFVLSLILCLFLVSGSVLAATKQDILDYAKGTYVIGGKSIKLANTDIVSIERFLNNNTLTQSQLDTTLANMKSFVRILQDAGVTEVNKLSTTQKDSLISLMESTATTLGLTLNIDNNSGIISIYQGGTQIHQFSLDKVLQFTGAEFNAMYIVLPALLVIALGGIVIYNRRSATNGK